MSTPEPSSARSLKSSVVRFRVLGGALLVFAALALVSVAVGLYYTFAESSGPRLFPSILIGGFGIAVLVMGVVGFRALRIKTVEELEEQSRSKWLEKLQSPSKSLERTRER